MPMTENTTFKLLNNKRSIRKFLSEMPLEQAEILFEKFSEAIAARREEEEQLVQERMQKERVLNELRDKMRELGISPEDLAFEQMPVEKKRTQKVMPKYEWTNEDGSVQQWSGRGLMPKAMQAAMERSGKSKEDFLL